MFERRINQQPKRRERGGATILGTVTLGIIFSTNSVMPAYAQMGPSLESDRTKEVVSPHKAQIPQATPAVLGPAWAKEALANFTDSSNTQSLSVIDEVRVGRPLAISGVAALDVASGKGVVSTESLQSALNRVAPNRQATPPKTEVNNQLENQPPETKQPTNGILSELPQDVAKQIDNSPHVPDKDKAHVKEMVLTAVNYELTKAANDEKSRISTAAMVAQYWTEAGFDGSGLSEKYNNLFGVKAGKDVPSDQKVNLPTWEADKNGKPYKTRADFRVYVDIGAAIAHYEEIMTTRGHFKDAVVAYEKYRDVDPAKAAEVFIRGVQFKIDPNGNILGNESRWATDPDYHKKNDSFRKKLDLVNLIEQAKGASLSQAAVQAPAKSISSLAEQIRSKSTKDVEAIKSKVETPVFTFGSPIVIEVKTPEKVDPIDPEPSDIEMIEATEPIITEAPVTDENKVAEEDVPEPKTPPAPSAPSEAEEEEQQTPAAEAAPEAAKDLSEKWAVDKNHKGVIDKQSSEWKGWVEKLGGNGNTESQYLRPVEVGYTVAPESNSLNKYGGGNKFHPNAAKSLEAMIHAFNEAFPGKYLTPGASFRSLEAQDKAWKDYQNGGNEAAKPKYDKDGKIIEGTSNHGWGVATDLRVSSKKGDVGESIRANTEFYKWLRENGHRFGWINPERMRPEVQKDSRKREPWHWVFVNLAIDTGNPQS